VQLELRVLGVRVSKRIGYRSMSRQTFGFDMDRDAPTAPAKGAS
jgi:hypothetical protein